MQKIAQRKELLSSVDWLTEVIRRYSQARISNRPLESVNMKSQMRLLKVSICVYMSNCLASKLNCNAYRNVVEEARDALHGSALE